MIILKQSSDNSEDASTTIKEFNNEISGKKSASKSGADDDFFGPEEGEFEDFF